ncbi:MAG: hypothetical protein HXS47_02220 [Theionarchaea archaeon]|nr:hypothetical protein [Theionarchaea archaeon]
MLSSNVRNFFILVIVSVFIQGLLPISLFSQPSAEDTCVILTTVNHIPHSIPGVPLLLVTSEGIPESTRNFLIDYEPHILYVTESVPLPVKEQLHALGTVRSLSPEILSHLEGPSLSVEGYVILSDPDDPLYPAAQILQSYREGTILTLPHELQSEIQREWKFMQWELLGSMWGVWENALWNTSEDTLQWVGYRYLFTDNLFATHEFRTRMQEDEQLLEFLPADTHYIAIVGDMGTSMDYLASELAAHHILVPTLTHSCNPRSYRCYECEYSSFHQAHVEYSSVECFAPVQEINDVLFQDAPKYWVSSEKERDDLISMASPYIEAMPVPCLPLTLDYLLAESYAVGRFTGYDLPDTVAFISRSLFLPPQSDTTFLINNIEVPTYTEDAISLCEESGMTVQYYPVGTAQAHLLENAQNCGLFIYNGTGNSSFFLPHFYKMGEGVATSLNMEVEGIDPHTFLLYPGNGCISFWFPDLTKTYDITISEGRSQRDWKFTAARPELFLLVSDLTGRESGLHTTDIDRVVQESLPVLDHFNSSFAYISATGPVGSSEFPLWLIRKGVSGFCINVGMQEVLTNFEFEVLFLSRALAQIPVGDAVRYAKTEVHTAGYWYPLSGLWMSEEQHVREEATCLFGDPALLLSPPHPVDILSPSELFCDPLQEAQQIVDTLKDIEKTCSQLDIHFDTLESVISEAEIRLRKGDPAVHDYLREEYLHIEQELDALCQNRLADLKETVEGEEAKNILQLAHNAYAECRYTDCLILCSQIQPDSPKSTVIGGIIMASILLLLGIAVYLKRWR